MKLIKISAFAFLVAGMASSSAMQLPDITPIAHPLFPHLSNLLNIERYINELITKNFDMYATANYIVQYLKFKESVLSPVDIYELKELAVKAFEFKYMHLFEDLMMVKLNIFKLK